MGNHPRKPDGRRVSSAEFKRTTVQRILTGEPRAGYRAQRDPDLGAALRGRRRHRGGGH